MDSTGVCGERLAQARAEAERVDRGAGGEDDRELLAADTAHRVGPAHRRAQDVGDVLEHLVALAVPADVVHALEVVDVEHHQRDRVVRAAGALELGAQALVEVPVVVEAGERVGVREVLEARADLGVVERERSRVAEPAGKLELVLVEERVLPGAVDVQRALERAAGDQRNGDQRLRVRRRSGHERDAGVLVRLVGEDRAAVDDRPARDPLPVRDRAGEDLLRPRAAREDGQQLAPLLVRLVDVQVVVRDELAERVRDPLQERLGALLREHVVENAGKAPVRLDERV